MNGYDYPMDENDGFMIVNPLIYKYEQFVDNYHLVTDKNDFKHNIILPFEVNNLITSINYTYINKNAIYEQFILDMKRTTIYHIYLNKYNNECNRQIKHNKLYLLLHSDHNKFNKFNKFNHSLSDILLCFTQSIFYWPYKIIHYKYCNDNIHLGEISSGQKLKKKNNYIEYIDYNDNSIQFIIYKQLRIFELDEKGDDNTLKIINIEIHISFGTDNISLLKIY